MRTCRDSRSLRAGGVVKSFAFFVPRLPGMNEIIGAASKNRYAYAAMKKTWTERVAMRIMLEKQGKLSFNRVTVLCEWKEPNNRRDPDNCFAAVKFILDGMVKAGLIKQDSRKYIDGIAHKFGNNDKENPGVWVQVIERGE